MKSLKTLRWNLGIALIRMGYKIRQRGWKPERFSLRWSIGAFVLKNGYKLRGKIPMKTWSGNHI